MGCLASWTACILVFCQHFLNETWMICTGARGGSVQRGLLRSRAGAARDLQVRRPQGV